MAPNTTHSIIGKIRRNKQTAETPSRRKNMMKRDGPYHHFLKWALPTFFGMFGFYMQSVGLHYATYSYVHKMMTMPNATRYDLKYTTLADPLEDAMGRIDGANKFLPILDGVAVAFPLLFLTLSFIDFVRAYVTYFREGDDQVLALQTYTKVMISAGILFSLKGAVGAMTTVPDSSGWKVCVNRLTSDGLSPEGMQWMQDTHTLGDMFSVDWHFIVGLGHPLRYCSDMMYSGHTFVVTLFALGSYEQLRILLGTRTGNSRDEMDVKLIYFKMFCLLLLTFISVGEQIVEVYFVMMTHFHYTMDIVVAIVMVFLVFTNGPIAVFSKQWESRGLHLLIASYPPPEKDSPDADMEMWMSRGDIFLPPCCVPCCCFSGREHLYSDGMVRDMVAKVHKLKEDIVNLETKATFRDPNNPTPVEEQLLQKNNYDVQKRQDEQRTFLKGEMNMHEGIYMEDFTFLFPDKFQKMLTQPLMAAPEQANEMRGHGAV